MTNWIVTRARVNEGVRGPTGLGATYLGVIMPYNTFPPGRWAGKAQNWGNGTLKIKNYCVKNSLAFSVV